ncbi:MAG: sodium-translocating pyrophosphatase [Clostridia bacterium]|nr:sodium-translocating pyrophosphatase [Clostridia bacterium]
MSGFIIMAAAVVITLLFAYISFHKVKKLKTGTDLMQEIALAIQEGANAFLLHELKVMYKIALLVALLLGVVVNWYVGVAFIIGAIMSGTAGFVGMKMATLANVRVSNTARETKSLGQTLKVAFRGGSVMGLSVGGFAMLGLLIVFVIFGKIMGQMESAQLAIHTNWIGINYIPFTMTISGYALGCSLIAMFDRVGGGIFTKAADMGADLVGKTEAHIPEDDPRNPATIADNVGDNVGDVAGLGADLLESYVGAIISSIVLASYMFFISNKAGTNAISAELVQKLITYPVIFAAIGLLSCVVGILSLLVKNVSEKPHKELNISVWISAATTVITTGILTYFMFRGETSIETARFNIGIMSPWVASITGIVSGVLIGLVAEYYTSYDYKPTQHIAKSSVQGTALTITTGLSSGMKSVLLPVGILATAIISSYYFAGIYGVTMAAIGMLSFVATTVSVDTYGPIADNAGGIAEMSKLAPEVRKITDKLDSVGNTTAAIGKGFAIGSAALAALSLLASYLYSQVNAQSAAEFTLQLNVLNPLALAGAIVGGALPFFFSGVLIDAVAKAAGKMVDEVRRQFKMNPKILTGEERPDYKTCISISSAGALKEMKLPAFIAIMPPLIGGFIFGAEFVGGLLIGTLLSGIMLALFTANSGGAWDNAKKYVEQGGVDDYGKGSAVHDSTIIGDTVGDPLKDTVGPSLDILIKIMSVISLIGVSIFQKFNLLTLLGLTELFK